MNDPILSPDVLGCFFDALDPLHCNFPEILAEHRSYESQREVKYTPVFYVSLAAVDL